MASEQRPNTGILSKNDRKEKDTHPDIKGAFNIEGVEYWLDGWKKDGSKGPFYSLSVKPKNPPAQQQATSQQRPAAANGRKPTADSFYDSPPDDAPF